MSEQSRTASTRKSKARDEYQPQTVKFYMPTIIDEDTIYDLIRTLHALDHRDTVYLYFNCLGGDLYTSLTLQSVVESIPNMVIGINLGKVYSGAVLPFLACDTRVSVPHARILVHTAKASNPDFSSSRDLKSFVTEMEGMDLIYRESLIKLVGDSHLVDTWLKDESYIESDRASRLGLIHHISTEVL